MKSDSLPDDLNAAPSTPLRMAGQHANALVPAVVGLAALISAQFMPWVTVRSGRIDWLFGQDSEQAVRTFRLADLSGAATPLYVGWVVLFGAFAAAWVKPSWRRIMLRVACVIDVAIAFRTVNLLRPASEMSGLPASDIPTSRIRSGALIALLGVVLVTAALAALMAPPRQVRSKQPASQPPIGAGWSARPAWVPWWRRRAPVAGAVLGVVAALLVAGTTVWLALNRPAAPRDHSGDLRGFLVAAPIGSAPNPYVPGDGGELGAGLVAQQSLGATEPADMFSLVGMRRAVAGGWIESNGTAVLVTLIQFNSDDTASGFLHVYGLEAQKRSGGESAAIGGLRGGRSFVNAARDGKDRVRVDAIALRGDVVLLITQAQPGSVDVARVNTLVREQYDRL